MIRGNAHGSFLHGLHISKGYIQYQAPGHAEKKKKSPAFRIMLWRGICASALECVSCITTFNIWESRYSLVTDGRLLPANPLSAPNLTTTLPPLNPLRLVSYPASHYYPSDTSPTRSPTVVSPLESSFCRIYRRAKEERPR